MPKSELPIVQFDGGENSDADPRDIADNEVAYLRGLYTDRKGMLRAGGSIIADSGSPTTPAAKLGGLLSVDVDNPSPSELLLGHNGTAIANAPSPGLSLTTARPVLSYFEGGIHISDGDLGANGSKRFYYRVPNRTAIGGSVDAGVWTEMAVSSEVQNSYSTAAQVAVSSHEALRMISTGTPEDSIYMIGTDEVIVLYNQSSIEIDVFFFYTNNATISVEDLPGMGRVIVHIPFNGNTPSANTVVSAINNGSALITATLGDHGALYTGNNPFLLIEKDVVVALSGATTAGVTDNYDNEKGTLWYYSAANYTNFRLRNRSILGNIVGTAALSAPGVDVSGNTFTLSNCPDHRAGDILEFVPALGGCCSVHFFSEKDDDAVLPSTTLQFAISHVFHKHVDTPPIPQGIGVKLYGGYGYNAHVLINTLSIPANVDIVRVWCRDGDRSDWLLFCEFDLAKGYRFFSQADYQALSADGATNVMKTGMVRVNEFGSATYRSINGYDPGDAIGAGYRAAAYAAGRMFAFGVRQKGVVDTDRVLVSPPTKAGLLPEKNFIVFSTEDGDKYNVAEGFGDKIIAFKNRKAFVVNVEGNEPATYFVEADYDGMGIEDRNQIARGDQGIFFMNANGLFFWNGSSAPVSIIQSRIEHWWRANYPTNANVSLGYSPLARKVVAVLGTNVVVFDLIGNGFSILVPSAGYTGLSNMQWTGSKLVFGRTADTGYQYTDAPSAQVTAEVRTKMFSMNVPGSRKKLKRIQLTFNRALTEAEKVHIRMSYSLDGQTWTPVANAALIQMQAYTTISAYQHVISPSRTAYAVQVRVDVVQDTPTPATPLDTWPADLQLLDISIVYKQKRPK